MSALTSYTLDLDDKIKFIALSHSPVLPPEPGESWVWLLDVTEVGYQGRGQTVVPYFTLIDGSDTPTMVAFHTPNAREDVERLGVRVGRTLVLKNAMVKPFPDRRMGFTVEDVDTMIPVPVRRLRQLNHQLRDANDQERIMACSSCGKDSKMGCSRCSSRYCSKECQTSHWPTHKKDCKALKKLHEWNETNWG